MSRFRISRLVVATLLVVCCQRSEEAPLLSVHDSARGDARKAVRHQTLAAPTFGVQALRLSSRPSDDEIRSFMLTPETLVPSAQTSPDDNAQLRAALVAYVEAGAGEDTAALERFVSSHPESPWTPSLLLNLGLIAYRTGYFTRALVFWEAAWTRTKDRTDRRSSDIADRAIAEFILMNARVGHKSIVRKRIQETRSRAFRGQAGVKMESAREGLWTMENKPGVAYRCGPYALTNLLPILNPKSTPLIGAFLRKIASPDTGFSLAQVYQMSKELGLDLQMARREPGAKIIVPSVIHWKLGHFGALVETQDGQHRLKDPTFGNETWMSTHAVDEESSGYHLVPLGPLPPGWRAVSSKEASGVFGKGHSGNSNPDDTGPDDHKSGGNAENCAMATYSFHTLLASLSVSDTPIQYRTAIGPDVSVRITYNQREAGQPAEFNFTHFSPRWVSSWVSYLTDDPSRPGSEVRLRKRGGGGEVFTLDSETQSFVRDVKQSSELVRLSPNTYVRRFNDGSQEFYEHYIGTIGTDRRVFLSRVQDPHGNEVRLHYNAARPTRIERIVDATNLTTRFHYENPEDPYLVTRIEDPYGRSAALTYADSHGTTRLQSIEDPIGIVSSFSYDATGGMQSMTTPYGATRFTLSPTKIGESASLIRFIEATDPLGDKERVEYNLRFADTGLNDNSDAHYPDPEIVQISNFDFDDRNSFYWDKKAMRERPGDYAAARIFHWIQPGYADEAISILESEKAPLEGRVWYNYPDQPAPYVQGRTASPSVVARVVLDADGKPQTQAHRYEYNHAGRATRTIDPLGRELIAEYAENAIDMVALKVRDPGAPSVPKVLARFSYNPEFPKHSPESRTDADGQTTRYTYNAFGQLKTITNPLGESTVFGYKTTQPGLRRLESITGDVPGGPQYFTYDDKDRIHTVTNADGDTVQLEYDALNRVTKVVYPDDSFEELKFEHHSLVGARDRVGRWTRYTENALRQRIMTRDPLGNVTQYEWCRCGSLKKVIDGNGNATEWKHDLQGRVTSKHYADGTSERSVYDTANRLVATIDALDQTTRFSYTLANQLEAITYQNQNTPNLSFAYDPVYGRITQRTDGLGITRYQYHPYDEKTPGAGQLASVDGPFEDDTHKYTYDELGRVKAFAIVDDATQSHSSYIEKLEFDAYDRPTRIENNLGLFRYEYERTLDRLKRVHFPNGMTSAFTYHGQEHDRAVKTIQHTSGGPNPASISEFSYTYNPDRTIRTWSTRQGSHTPSTWTFGYDAIHQLTDAVRSTGTPNKDPLESHQYTYDKNGNRIESRSSTGLRSTHRNAHINALNQHIADQGFGPTLFSGTVNEPAQISINGKSAKVRSHDQDAKTYRFEAQVDLKEGDNQVTVEARDATGNTDRHTYSVTTDGLRKTYAYDHNGNLREERSAAGDLLRVFDWDQENRLIRIIEGTHQTVLTYDALDRRVRIQELDDGTETENHTFIWCGSTICQKRDQTGKTVLRAYFAHGFEQDEKPHFYTRDHLGSIREVVDTNGTFVHARYDYDPFGAVRTIEAQGRRSDHLYTGHPYHTPSALHLPHYRAYDAHNGRWLSRDPLGYADGLNPYAYVHNNPISFWDPDGRFVGPAPAPAPPAVLLGPGAVVVVALVVAAIIVYYALSDDCPGGNDPPSHDPPVASRDRGPQTNSSGQNHQTETSTRSERKNETVTISSSRYPETAAHIKDAQADGQPSTLTVERDGAKSRRRKALKGKRSHQGTDRDEYPPAMFEEGGAGSSVRNINPSDNRGAGACIGAQCRGLPNGTRVDIKVD